MNDYFKQDSDDNQTPDIFDKNGRAYPDVSALGENMQFFSNNQLKTLQYSLLYNKLRRFQS